MTDTASFASLPAPVPRVDPDSEGFWAAAAEGTFAVCRCTQCRTWMNPALERCRRCGAEVAFEPVSGRGEVHSFIVVRHPAVPGFELPYVVAFVHLDEQDDLRFTAVIDADPEAVHVGMRVLARMEPVGDSGLRYPVFDPAG